MTKIIRWFDSLLSAEPLPRQRGMMGHTTWVGDLRALGEAIGAAKFELACIKDAGRRGDALAAAVSELADFGLALGQSNADPARGNVERRESEFRGDETPLTNGTMQRGAFGSSSTASARPEEQFDVGTSAEPLAINEANRNFWDKNAQRYRAGARDSAAITRHRAGTIARMQAEINAHYANCSPPSPPRTWGGG
ncbi:MAG: hypothetical protein ACLPTZ_19385 [Beijerinckiaceae bacterium]|jgi:hypothetical protein